MICSAITLSLVPQARGGPFVFWDDLEAACAKAAELGFDAIEIFAPSPGAIRNLGPVLERHNLKLAALGTGAGWVIHKWSLTHPDAAIRQKALDFIRSFLDAGAPFRAPAILGSMQGRIEAFRGDTLRGAPASDLIKWAESAAGLSESLLALDEHAGQLGTKLFVEPLNRYETNIFNSVLATANFLRELNTKNIRVLADLFHMNIEDADICGSLRHAGPLLGHVHLADSNRLAAGFGHLDLLAVAQTLREMNYSGYASGEVLPAPSSDEAARQQITEFRRLFPRS